MEKHNAFPLKLAKGSPYSITFCIPCRSSNTSSSRACTACFWLPWLLFLIFVLSFHHRPPTTLLILIRSLVMLFSAHSFLPTSLSGTDPLSLKHYNHPVSIPPAGRQTDGTMVNRQVVVTYTPKGHGTQNVGDILLPPYHLHAWRVPGATILISSLPASICWFLFSRHGLLGSYRLSAALPTLLRSLGLNGWAYVTSAALPLHFRYLACLCTFTARARPTPWRCRLPSPHAPRTLRHFRRVPRAPHVFATRACAFWVCFWAHTAPRTATFPHAAYAHAMPHPPCFLRRARARATVPRYQPPYYLPPPACLRALTVVVVGVDLFQRCGL